MPPFEIKPLTPDNSETWNVLWPEDRDDPLLQSRHAYKALQAGGAITVYYSTIFRPYREMMERLEATHPTRCIGFDTNYAVWIGYHAILQNQQPVQETSGVSDEALEQIQELERQTVAKVQVRQALGPQNSRNNRSLQPVTSVSTTRLGYFLGYIYTP